MNLDALVMMGMCIPTLLMGVLFWYLYPRCFSTWFRRRRRSVPSSPLETDSAATSPTTALPPSQTAVFSSFAQESAPSVFPTPHNSITFREPSH